MKNKLKNAKSVFIIGIKGAGTSAIAKILHSHGKTVSGSDVAQEYFTDALLRSLKIKVTDFGETKSFKEFDAVIFSTAFDEKNPDLALAKSEGIACIPYPEALGEVADLFQTSIAVSGSHGKSTITSLLSYTLERGSLDPTAVIGAEVVNWHTNARSGGSNYFVFEADEYQNKFQYYNPSIIVLNNINYEHPDFFEDMDAYTKAFADFVTKLPNDGIVVANRDHAVVRTVVEAFGKNVIWYGEAGGADWQLLERVYDNGTQILTIGNHGKKVNVSLSLIGKHNALNALPVVALADRFGISLDTINAAFQEFKGTRRRLELIAKTDMTIIDDYAHHPVEIQGSLSALQEAYPNSRILCVFQPHTFTRTQALLKDFAQAFKGVDELVLMSIFGSARETQGSVSIEDLKKVVEQHTKNVTIVDDVAAAVTYLKKNTKKGDLVVTMGAGDTWKVAQDFAT